MFHKPGKTGNATDENRNQCGSQEIDRSHSGIYETRSHSPHGTMTSMASSNCARLLFRPYFSKMTWLANVTWRIAPPIQLQLYPNWLWIGDLCRDSLSSYCLKSNEHLLVSSTVPKVCGCFLAHMVRLHFVICFFSGATALGDSHPKCVPRSAAKGQE